MRGKRTTKGVRDMRDMRGKAESRQEIVRNNLPTEPFWRAGVFMHHPRAWPANGLQQDKVIGVHTYIYADSGQFCSRRKGFFPQLLQPLQGRILHEMHRAYMVQHAVKTGLVHLLGREKSPGAKAQMFVGL